MSDEPKKIRKRLTEPEKAQLVLMKSQGFTTEAICKHFGIKERTIYRVMNSMVKDKILEPRDGGPPPIPNAKKLVTDLAYPAVEAGLRHEDDPYKRGNLGVRVLQGVGEFQPEGGGINVLNLFNTLPPEYRARYIVSTED